VQLAFLRNLLRFLKNPEIPKICVIFSESV